MMITNIEQMKNVASITIDKKKDQLMQLSKDIWNNPELAYKEYKAHELLTSFLAGQGFQVTKHTPLETSFIAEFGNKCDGVTVGICCEYDALPGIGHACGHNLIAEASVGAALGAKEAIATCTDFDGKIIVFGTPAEECGGGKANMIKSGAFDECDVCMMAHPALYDLQDPVMVAVSQFKLIFRGKTTNSVLSPWEGTNALDAAVQCYNAISMLRQQAKPTSRIHAIISKGGYAPNNIPDESELFIYVRGVRDEDMLLLKQKVVLCGSGSAEATGCFMELVDVIMYNALKSNKALLDYYVKNAEQEGIVFNYAGSKQGGSTDMGNLSVKKPSIHPKFKVQSTSNIHTAGFNDAAILPINQLPTIRVAKCLAKTALDVLTNVDLLDLIRKDFHS